MRTHACTALALCAFVACAEPSEAPASAPATPDPPPPTEETNESDEADEADPPARREKTPTPSYEWGEGPPLVPVGGLRAWLGDATRASKMLKLPVVVHFDDAGLGIAGAFVGVKARNAGPEDLQIGLDQGAMGIDLMTRLREHCAPKSPSCVVWLRGTWGPLVDLPGSSETEVFAVREVLGLVATDATAEGTHAQEAR